MCGDETGIGKKRPQSEIKKINNSEEQKSKCCMENIEIYVCGKVASEKTFIDFLRNGFSRARFFPHIFRRGKIFLCSRGARVHSEAGERGEVVKKEIFCSCVLHRGASHYKANTRHTFAHFWGGLERM